MPCIATFSNIYCKQMNILHFCSKNEKKTFCSIFQFTEHNTIQNINSCCKTMADNGKKYGNFCEIKSKHSSLSRNVSNQEVTKIIIVFEVINTNTIHNNWIWMMPNWRRCQFWFGNPFLYLDKNKRYCIVMIRSTHLDH